MNEAIVRNHNSVVALEDDVYVLGDLMLGDNEKGIECIRRMNGKLHIVYGNHDTSQRKQLYSQLSNFVEGAEAISLKYKKQNFFLSHYPCITSNNDYDKPLKQRLLNVCGHTHTTNKWQDKNIGYIYHVEMDAHACYPTSLDIIIQEFYEEFQRKEQQNDVIRYDELIAEKYLYQRKYCDKCVFSYGYGCPGPTLTIPAKCPDGIKYKRDPPDGGFYG